MTKIDKNDTSKMTSSKMFWKTVKLMFSNKSVNRENITLAKDDKILSKNLEVAETFNVFFLEHSKRDEHIFRPGLRRFISRIQL